MASLIPSSATSAISILLISILVTFTMQPLNLLKQTVLLLSASTYAADLTAWEQIHQVIHTYPLAIDGKDFDLFEKVFERDAVANYTGPLSNLQGFSAIQSSLAASVANVDSQHLLGTTTIDVAEAGTANSTTYFQATLFGKPYYPGSLVTLYGLYLDDFVYKNDWLISKRTLVFQGPGMVGNLTLTGM